jgi:hypothetical protein
MMHSLQQMFPSLTTFSDLNWDDVTQEYEATSIDISFPEYLQKKALEGDCPPYLFELAFYELAAFDAKTSVEPFPHQHGIHLNPTALFLSLEFDVPRMLEEAEKGNIKVIERPHVLCLFRDKEDHVNAIELSEESLELLQHLENGPRADRSFIKKSDKDNFDFFKEKGLILDLLDLPVG